MKVVMTGGGSGGHVTPIKYVAQALKELAPDTEIYYIGQKNDRFASLIDGDKNFTNQEEIYAGKFRRFPRVWWRTLIDLPTHIKNFRDFFYFSFGTLQSLFKLSKIKPDVIFAKGGFVSVPVGIAAALRKTPIITHDSDAIPGLANRIVSRWAKYNAVGQNVEYKYPKSKLRYTGVPINPIFTKKTSKKMIEKFRPGFFNGDRTVMVVGGSLGAKSINLGINENIEALTNHSINVIHIVGKNDINDAKKVSTFKNYLALEFVSDPDEMDAYYKMSDLIVSRAGATNTAEIAALGLPAIIIPATQLSDQLKNAEIIREKNAARVLTDAEIAEKPAILKDAIIELLNDVETSNKMANNFSKLVETQGAEKVAKLIIQAG